jgi:putative endonuclease
MNKGGYVYIMTNKYNRVLYTGVTSSIKGRVWQHKVKFFEKSFTARYNINKLVYYQFYATIDEAIAEEKRIKGGSRKKKIALIESVNPEWRDLWEEINV